MPRVALPVRRIFEGITKLAALSLRPDRTALRDSMTPKEACRLCQIVVTRSSLRQFGTLKECLFFQNGESLAPWLRQSQSRGSGRIALPRSGHSPRSRPAGADCEVCDSANH